MANSPNQRNAANAGASRITRASGSSTPASPVGRAAAEQRSASPLGAVQLGGVPGGPDTPTVVTADAAVADFVLAAGAAAGVQPIVVGSVDRLSARSAGAVICVGADRVAQVARAGLPRNSHVLLVGRPEDESILCQWSAPLAAAVVLMPDGIRWLTQVLAGGVSSHGTVIALIGGSGGLGTSTTALGLAAAAARQGLRSLLVDLDSTGGGIDLLCGAEAEDGWRWPRLAAAEGFLGDLRGELPLVDEVELVSMGRGNEHRAPGADAVTAVLRSAARTHDCIIVDLGRGDGEGAEHGALLADQQVLVSGAGVRQLAAATQVLQQARQTPRRVLVRDLKHGEVDPDSAAQVLELPCVGVIPDDSAIPVAQARGESPARAARRRWRRACDRALGELLGGPVEANRTGDRPLRVRTEQSVTGKERDRRSDQAQRSAA